MNQIFDIVHAPILRQFESIVISFHHKNIKHYHHQYNIISNCD